MKKGFFVIFTVVLSSVYAAASNSDADQRILECIRSSEFSSTMVNYNLRGQQSEVRVIHNPNRENLWGSDGSPPVTFSFMILADLPSDLFRHIQKLILPYYPENLTSNKDYYFHLRGNGPISEKTFTSLHPVGNADSDQRIINCMNSSEFVSKVAKYQLEGREYEVKVIHNPNRETLWGKDGSSPGSFSLMMIANLPIELLDHVSELISPICEGNKDIYVDLKGTSPISEKTFTSLHPISGSIADQRIMNCMHSSEFASEVVKYELEGREYEIRVIHNPKGENLWGKDGSSPGSFSLMMIADLPMSLLGHVNELISPICEGNEDVYVDLKGTSPISEKTFASLHPISGSSADQRIMNCMYSSEFASEIVKYELEGREYEIRIIHNPKGENLWGKDGSSPGSFSLMMIADLPMSLLGHVNELISPICEGNEDIYVDLKGTSSISEKTFASLHPISGSSADQRIMNCMYSSEFASEIVKYELEGREYEIRIIHNPKGETLWGKDLSSPVSFSFMMISDLPMGLLGHVNELISPICEGNEDIYVDLKGSDTISEKTFASLHPIIMTEKVDDPDINDLVEKTFSSESFVNQIFLYHLEGEYYQVRILHNPEECPFTLTKEFQFCPEGPLETYSVLWDSKYGIVVDKEAPQELIDSLSCCANSSWWDWYYSFTIHNGTFVEHDDTLYPIDSWFNFSEDFF